MNRGIQEVYYTRTLPANAVAIAEVKTTPALASELVDVLNVSDSGPLGIWRSSKDIAGPVDDLAQAAWKTAPALNQPVLISGSRSYTLDSKFFELTDKVASSTPLFYAHPLNSKASRITIIDVDGNKVETPTLVTGGKLYHSLEGGLYWVRYIDDAGALRKVLLKYEPAIKLHPYAPSESDYCFSGRTLDVYNVSAYYIRFTDVSALRILTPWNSPPNTPWFPRIRFGLTPPPPEWARQIFQPERPYMLATWVPGTVVDTHVIEFERKNLYADPLRKPDVLVFDKNFQFKYALEGTDTTVQRRRGTLYPWKRGQVADVDHATARVQVTPDLEPDDVCFGFYTYREYDIVFNAIDVNPFTNPDLKNCTVRFYTRTDSDPMRRIYYQVIDYSGNDVVGQTNDPNPVQGDYSGVTLIGDLFVGASVSSKQFTVKDVRVRGGGLAPEHQSIPQAANFFDIGFIDGKPYPVGGALVVYLPKSILNRMTREEVQGRVEKVIPMGALAHIRYIDNDGQEWL